MECLLQTKNKNTPVQQSKRVNFLVSLQAVFWAVSPDYEKILQSSSDPKKVDRKWVAFMKSTGKASLGIVDYKFEARKNL